MTDEEAIAVAMLLGCTFFESALDDRPVWFVNDSDNPRDHHPIEKIRREEWHRGLRPIGHWGWPTKAAVARDYIDWYRGK